MNAHIANAQAKFMVLFQEQRAAVAALPKRELVELQHAADDLRRSPASDYSLRVAAELIYTATTLQLEKK
jgi:hypothetical protein